MSASAAFFCGVVVGLTVALIVLALAKAAGTETPWEKEEAARQAADVKRDAIRQDEGKMHDLVATVTPGEMDLIVAGRVTLRDVLRGRDDPTSPFYLPKPGTNGGEQPPSEPAKP